MFPEMMNMYGPKLVLAVVVVAAALFLLFLLSRLLGSRNRPNPRRAGTATRARLAVVDTAQVDASRQLILVRRDDVEHLILVGGPSDVVVESRIGAIGSEPRTAMPSESPARMVQPAKPTPSRAIEPTAAPEPVKRPPAPEAPMRPASGERPAADRASEPQRVAPSKFGGPVQLPEGPRPTPESTVVHRDVEHALDDARGRVFGGAPAPDMKPVVSRNEPPAPVDRAPPEPTERFEDVLDAEIAGDLSAVTPGGAGRRPVPSEQRTPSPLAPKKATLAVDTEMDRLLGEISTKR